MDSSKFCPTPYKISTITATGSINTNINLDILFEHLSTKPAVRTYEIVYSEFGIKKMTTTHTNYKKRVKANRENETKKRFDNQVTIVFKYHSAVSQVDTLVNSKIFKNGNIQMTGLRYIEQGRDIIQKIITVLEKVRKIDTTVVSSADPIEITDFKIRLINCDFKVGFEIKRDKIYKVVQNVYNIPCAYEPCIYPGVKIQYWWNKQNVSKDGCCHCESDCYGKGFGDGEGDCKKITIAVFQSGCIIITGGQSIEQIDEAYAFICKCVKDNMENIFKMTPVLPPAEPKKKKTQTKKESKK